MQASQVVPRWAQGMRTRQLYRPALGWEVLRTSGAISGHRGRSGAVKHYVYLEVEAGLSTGLRLRPRGLDSRPARMPGLVPLCLVE